MKQIKIAVVGRNSSGKTSIAKMIVKECGLKLVQSYATRKPRPEEIANGLENSDHIFISDEEFDKLENIIAEANINGHRFCTTMDVLDNSDVYVIDPNGVEDLQQRSNGRYKIIQFYIYADKEKRKERYISRGETESEFESRESSEDEQFTKYETSHGWDIIIYNNGKVEDAVNTMKDYVQVIKKSMIAAKQAAEEAEKVKTESGNAGEAVKEDGEITEENFSKNMNPPVENPTDEKEDDSESADKTVKREITVKSCCGNCEDTSNDCECYEVEESDESDEINEIDDFSEFTRELAEVPADEAVDTGKAEEELDTDDSSDDDFSDPFALGDDGDEADSDDWNDNDEAESDEESVEKSGEPDSVENNSNPFNLGDDEDTDIDENVEENDTESDEDDGEDVENVESDMTDKVDDGVDTDESDDEIDEKNSETSEAVEASDTADEDEDDDDDDGDAILID